MAVKAPPKRRYRHKQCGTVTTLKDENTAPTGDALYCAFDRAWRASTEFEWVSGQPDGS